VKNGEEGARNSQLVYCNRQSAWLLPPGLPGVPRTPRPGIASILSGLSGLSGHDRVDLLVITSAALVRRRRQLRGRLRDRSGMAGAFLRRSSSTRQDGYPRR